MKKTIISLVLLVLAIGTFVAYTQYKKITEDKEPPVLSSKSDTITASVKITDEELLEGVTATDEDSGDITNTLVIESISDFVDENTRIITYAAIDDSMNVGRLERTLVYTDYEEPKFQLKKPLSFPVGSKADLLDSVSASSTLDGDISTKIHCGFDEAIDNTKPGKYPIEFRVTDSGGKTVHLNTEVEIYEDTYSGVNVELKKYLTYIKTGANFKAEAYFKESDKKGELSIVSDVDTKKPGTYYADYYVNGDNASGKSRLVVVVY